MDANSRPLRRPDASRYLLEQHGIKHSPEYLAKLAVTGKGPRFRKLNRTVIYTPALLDEYAAEITSPIVRSTTEFQATEAA